MGATPRPGAAARAAVWLRLLLQGGSRGGSVLDDEDDMMVALIPLTPNPHSPSTPLTSHVPFFWNARPTAGSKVGDILYLLIRNLKLILLFIRNHIHISNIAKLAKYPPGLSLSSSSPLIPPPSAATTAAPLRPPGLGPREQRQPPSMSSQQLAASAAPDSAASRRWDAAHAMAAAAAAPPPPPFADADAGSSPASASTPPPSSRSETYSRLYTDENPATTIKGTGYRSKRIALRTIELTSQPGARYKRYWTIRAMRERAAHHPRPTEGMRDAIRVFDEWLERYEEPTDEERREMEEEWRAHKRLCESAANAHAYGPNPSREELRRSRDDGADGRRRLFELLAGSRPDGGDGRRRSPKRVPFPLASFVAVFGGPGLHGYGRHRLDLEPSASRVEVDGLEGLEELIGRAKASKLGFVDDSTRIRIDYARKDEVAAVVIEGAQSMGMLKLIWGKAAKKNNEAGSTNEVERHSCGEKRGCCDNEGNQKEQSWTCSACTFVHSGPVKIDFLSCEICGTVRRDAKRDSSSEKALSRKSSAKAALAPTKAEEDPATSNEPLATKTHPVSPSSWGSLRAPSDRDVVGARKRRRALDRPPPLLDYIVVLDFEWTADRGRKMEPVAEITQFPSVLLRLSENSNCIDDDTPRCHGNASIPCDLRRLSDASLRGSKRDAWCVDFFDSFVRPTLNAQLTAFSVELTGITQDDIDAAPTIDRVIPKYLRWLQSRGLVDGDGNRTGNWCFATWGDVDLMTTLRLELKHKRIDLPRCFDRWINLKDDAVFKRHYRREPRGGLRSCVESIGADWEGRAHNGLVDSINTAKIVRHMVQTGFRFVRSTRGFDRNGVPFGQKNEQG
ncbi:hypothetical protein ACHAWF_016793 [Thalassiosira exigua]